MATSKKSAGTATAKKATEKKAIAPTKKAPVVRTNPPPVAPKPSAPIVTPIAPPAPPAPAVPKTPRAWYVTAAGYKRRRVVALDADAAVKAFAAEVLTGGNLADIGTGITNPDRSVDYVISNGSERHLANVEADK